MNLAVKSNQDLLQDLQVLVQEEKRCTHQVLKYLEEVETRKLFLEKGYSSLFAFCTEFLGYSESEAQIRIQAMRLAKALPAVAEKIKTGQISLSVAASVQSTFRKEDQRRKCEGQKPLTLTEKTSVVTQVEKTSVRDSQKILAQVFPETAIQAQDRIRPLDETKSKIEFVASNELVEKLERLKQLTAHRNFDGKLEKLIELLADMALKKLDPMSRASEPKGPAGAPPHGAHKVNRQGNSRYIPAKTKHRVFIRDHGRCQYQDPASGKSCHSKHGIEFDHQMPFFLGGEATPKNIQLLCSSHNKFKSNQFG